MFKKSASKCVQVRVRGNDEVGYTAEFCLYPSRFFPFRNTWSVIESYHSNQITRGVYPTLELAQKEAMSEYNRWVEYLTFETERKKKQIARDRSRTVWRHP